MTSAVVVADEAHQEVAIVTDMTTDVVAATAVVATTTVAVLPEVMMTDTSDEAMAVADVKETMDTEAGDVLTDTKAVAAAADVTTTQLVAVTEEAAATTQNDVKSVIEVTPLGLLHAMMHHLVSLTVAALEASMDAKTDMLDDKHIARQQIV